MSISFVTLCRLLSWAAAVLLVLVWVGVVAFAVALGVGWLPELWAPDFTRDGAALSVAQRVGIWLLALAVAVPLAIALGAMTELFGNFARGEVFTDRAARIIRRIGAMIALGGVLKVVAGAARSVVVSISNPPGERMLAISFGSDEALLLLLGGLLVVIGHAMAEAARIEAEMRTII